MLVVTANRAFSDGTLVPVRGRAAAAWTWLRDVRRGVVRGCFGRDGVYRPPRAVDLVLAGDTFDGFLSAAWCGRERPWHAGPRTAAMRRDVLGGCARRAAPLLGGLARLAGRGLDVPAADRRGRPSVAGMVRVPVRVVLLVGDRDRHLPEVAAAVVARGGVVAPVWVAGTVAVRHGHEFDLACQGDETSTLADRPPTLAESVAVDLVVRFIVGLAAVGVDRRDVAPLVESLAEAAPGDLAAVVESWTAGPSGMVIDPASRRDVAAAWRRAVDGWVRETRRQSPDCGLPASPIEALAAWYMGDSREALPPAVAALLDRRPPAAAGGRDEVGRLVVLGHQLPWSADAETICLGRPPLRRFRPVAVVRADRATEVACVAANASVAEPPTIVCDAAAEEPRWWPITGAFPGPVDQPSCRTVVVDAA